MVGHPAPHAWLEQPSSMNPLRFVVVLDLSGSMSGASERLLLRAALSNLLYALPDGVEVSLVGFHSEAHLIETWTRLDSRSRVFLLRAGMGEETQGCTRIASGIGLALDLLSDGGTIICLSDGGDSSWAYTRLWPSFFSLSHAGYSDESTDPTLAEVALRARDQGVVINCLGISADAPCDSGALSYLAGRTRGKYFSVSHRRDLKRLCGQIIVTMGHESYVSLVQTLMILKRQTGLRSPYSDSRLLGSPEGLVDREFLCAHRGLPQDPLLFVNHTENIRMTGNSLTGFQDRSRVCFPRVWCQSIPRLERFFLRNWGIQVGSVANVRGLSSPHKVKGRSRKDWYRCSHSILKPINFTRAVGPYSEITKPLTRVESHALRACNGMWLERRFWRTDRRSTSLLNPGDFSCGEAIASWRILGDHRDDPPEVDHEPQGWTSPVRQLQSPHRHPLLTEDRDPPAGSGLSELYDELQAIALRLADQRDLGQDAQGPSRLTLSPRTARLWPDCERQQFGPGRLRARGDRHQPGRLRQPGQQLPCDWRGPWDPAGLVSHQGERAGRQRVGSAVRLGIGGGQQAGSEVRVVDGGPGQRLGVSERGPASDGRSGVTRGEGYGGWQSTRSLSIMGVTDLGLNALGPPALGSLRTPRQTFIKSFLLWPTPSSMRHSSTRNAVGLFC